MINGKVPVVVTTSHRGVFFGYATEQADGWCPGDPVVLLRGGA